MKKKLGIVFLGLLMVLPSMNVFADEGAFEPKNVNINTSTEKNYITFSEIEKMSNKELEKLHLLPLNSTNLQSVNSSYLVTQYNVKQINSYYCGPASTLQMIKTAGRSSGVSGSTDTAKQRTLANNSYLGTDRDGATWINNVSKTLNTLIPRHRKWTQRTINVNDRSTLNVMTYYIRSNHSFGNAVNYLLFPGSLSYYPTTNRSGHFISGSGIYHKTNSSSDHKNIDLRLNDPHYDSRYFGTHREPLLNVARGMHNYSTNRGPANFVY